MNFVPHVKDLQVVVIIGERGPQGSYSAENHGNETYLFFDENDVEACVEAWPQAAKECLNVGNHIHVYFLQQ